MFSKREYVAIRKEYEEQGDDFFIDLEEGEYRFINEACIDDILLEELSDDSYIVGCFNSWAIADATDMPVELIEIIQNAGEHEKLGRWIIDNGSMEKLAEIYVRNDGYGHHFSHYDGECHEVSLPLNGSTIRLYAFRVN